MIFVQDVGYSIILSWYKKTEYKKQQSQYMFIKKNQIEALERV